MMTKAERIEYMRATFAKRAPSPELVDAVLPVTSGDVRDEMNLMDSVREDRLDKSRSSLALTNDAR